MTSSFEDECQQHLNWMQSLISGSGSKLQSAESKPNVYEQQINDLLASIEVPPPSNPNSKSSIGSKYEQDFCRPSVEPSPLTGHTQPHQYRISDPVDSEDDSDCEEYYVEDAEEIRGQEVPQWARANQLHVELRKQQFVDPDRIFIGFQRSCDLSDMFENKKKTFKMRGESGWWASDEVTPAEEARYKKAIGLE